MKRLALLYVVGLVVAMAGCEAVEPGVADDVASTASAVTSADVSGDGADMYAQFWHYCVHTCTVECMNRGAACSSAEMLDCAVTCDIFYPGHPNLTATDDTSAAVASGDSPDMRKEWAWDECMSVCDANYFAAGGDAKAGEAWHSCAHACSIFSSGANLVAPTTEADMFGWLKAVCKESCDTQADRAHPPDEVGWERCLSTCDATIGWSNAPPTESLVAAPAPEDGDNLGWTPVGSCLRGCTAERDSADQGCTPSRLIGTNMSQADCHELHRQDNEMCRSSCKLILGGCIDWPVCGGGSL